MKGKWIYYCLFFIGALVWSCGDAEVIDNTNPKEEEGEKVVDEQIPVPFDYRGVDNRPHLTGNSYTQEEKNELKRKFEEQMSKAKTVRGKVATAGLFLLAEFDYCIPYAFPIWHHTNPDVDPEYRYFGMFMEKGLFLDEIHHNGLVYKPWGASYPSGPVRPHWPNVKNMGETVDNGFTCSQYVGWALINAGITKYGNQELYSKWAGDLRVYPGSQEVSLKRGYRDIRPGDLIGFEGHIALVVAVVEDKYVIFGSADGGGDVNWRGHGVRWHMFNRETTNYDTFQYKFLIKMAGVYKD
ncbi:hypothetical protein [Proteiniphilum sp. X52]|uniref:hypothetical protein n=1 Tax=Proteiniphilum sp. X52 TaxID=2382159 RepID=UPI000F09A58C|nr:hypothetical protein [Proteiniphilum sp. X52]RNC66798.1 hypothetical protein D7D25_00570 [Proteiniphilum sp. X52]